MRIKPGYFILALIVVISICYILGNREINNQDQSGTNSSLINITPDKLQDSISVGISFVLFYQPNSDVCKNMEYKLNRLALEKGKMVRFYTVKIKENINKQIQAIESEENNIFQKSISIIALLETTFDKLKEFVSNYTFNSQLDEITFFKETKPQLFSILIYHRKVYNLGDFYHTFLEIRERKGSRTLF